MQNVLLKTTNNEYKFIKMKEIESFGDTKAGTDPNNIYKMV